MMSESKKRPMPLAEVSKTLRNCSRLSPTLQRLIDESREHSAGEADGDFDVQQVAAILKASEIATRTAPDHAANFQFAAGYIAGLVLNDTDYATAKALAATL